MEIQKPNLTNSLPITMKSKDSSQPHNFFYYQKTLYKEYTIQIFQCHVYLLFDLYVLIVGLVEVFADSKILRTSLVLRLWRFSLPKANMRVDSSISNIS